MNAAAWLASSTLAVSSALPVAPAVPVAEAGGGGLTKWLVLGGLFVLGSLIVMVWARWVRTMHLALGFAATAALWAVGYLSMMQPGLALGEILFATMLAVLFVAGFVAGRFGDHEVRPVSVGLVSAFANLLVLGAFLRDEQHGSNVTPLVYVAGLFIASALLAWLGGVFGRAARSARDASPLPNATALFAIVAATTVFLLLITGGLVTSYESGLAVPDWPNSYGHNMLLYPVSEMKGGIFYEHAHRLYGMLVGTTALVLVVVVWRSERESWLRSLAVITLLAVCFQGYLGGTRVTGNLTLSQQAQDLAPSIIRAIFHGVFAQLVFASFLMVAAATSRTWKESRPILPRAKPTSAAPELEGGGLSEASLITDRSVALILPWAFVIQSALGALYRHLQPPGGVTAEGHPMWAILAHMAMAVVVTALVVIAGGRAWGHNAHPVLRRLGLFLMHGVGVQLCLGVAAVAAVWIRTDAAIPGWEAILVTTHQVTGAGLLGGAVLLAAWSKRLILPAGDARRMSAGAAMQT